MLFNYKLLPLEAVQAWGEPGHLSLHWFGLTDGYYWIEAGEQVLFKYSDHAHLFLGAPQYCNYQVARLHEDLLTMVPIVMEPVPASLVSCIAGEAGSAWGERRFRWLNDDANRLGDDRIYEIADASGSWIGSRTLDSAYLSPPAVIRMWSDEDLVHLEWDNRAMLVGGLPAWSATCGAHLVSREQFLVEVRSFHERLMEEMDRRIQRVTDGALPPQVRVDLASLQREHVRRRAQINRLLGSSDATDWRAVEAAVQTIERGHAAGA